VGRRAPICDPEVGEGLHDVDVRPGLGLTEATVDVLCAQWGTLPRLIHAVQEAQVPQGWGLDESTALELRDGVAQAIHGNGAAWSADVASPGSSVVVRRHLAGPLQMT
jgi:cyanophycinase